MHKGRMEAFSDGVLAIIITIMVLEMKVPHGATLDDLYPILPVFLSYVLSFVNIGIYWNNHHHLMQTAKHVNGKILWANVHLLFWLSLIPFASGWMGENHFAKWPVILYGVILFMAGVAYYFLAHSLVRVHGKESTIGKALGSDRKGVLSVVIYALGIAAAFYNAYLGFAAYIIVTAIWFIPDKRMERHLSSTD